jgi:hypothetical protein
MFTIETIKVRRDPSVQSRNSVYSTMSIAETYAYHLVESQEHGNYTEIGSGCYAEVYGMKKSPIVYKIGNAVTNVGYMAYIKELSKQTEHNPYLPKIHAVRIYDHSRHDKWFVVAMERLKPGHNYAFFDACSTLRDLIEGGIDDEEIKGDLLKIKHIFPDSLKRVVNVVRKAHSTAIKKSYEVGWDLHDGNFMMRGNKQIVITDPLA